MKRICSKTTLFEYDGHQIFEAEDRIGGHYLGVAVLSKEQKDQFLVVGAEPEQLRKFRNGVIDLRSLIIDSSIDEWYLTESSAEESTFEIKLQSGSLQDHDYLPDEGFFLNRVQLVQALEELDQIVDEAQSEGYEIPSSVSIVNAERIIKRIYDNLSHPFQVYPMPDGEVAVDVTDDNGSSVLILCCSDGGTLCFVNINGNQRRARYSNSDALPDCFMHEALEELQQNINS